ncbi:hypothetical protein BH11CYA1_BH11CYA1_02300 [soil metagenome]
MKRKLLTCALYFLAASVWSFSTVGTICGAFASGGNRVRFELVPPASPETVPASSMPTSGLKGAPKKKGLMEEAVTAYKSGFFDKAVSLFQELLLREPTNAQAHYYYANCLARQGQNSAARFEYQSTLHYSKNADLTSYSNQALKNLAAMPTSSLSSTTPASTASTASGAPLFASPEKAAHYDRQLERLRAEVNSEYHRRLDEKRAELNRKTGKVRQEVEDEINATPRYYPAVVRTPNLNYDSAIAAIQVRGDNKIKILTSDYQDEFRLIDEVFTKRLDALSSSHQNLKGQMGATVGSSQVTPAGTTFYVRNYVNFGGVQENVSHPSVAPFAPPSPGLKAVPGRLKPF